MHAELIVTSQTLDIPIYSSINPGDSYPDEWAKPGTFALVMNSVSDDPDWFLFVSKQVVGYVHALNVRCQSREIIL